MGLEKLDILSESPNVSIFNEDSNKTLFGGILSLIYIVLFILMTLSYLIDFYENGKYKVEYGIQQRIHNENDEFIKNPEYNPNLTFAIDFKQNENIDLSERFVIYDMKKGELIQRNEEISYSVSDLNTAVLYKCEDENCSLNENDKTNIFYIMNFKYQGYELDHQGDVQFINLKIYLLREHYFSLKNLPYNVLNGK